MTWKQEADNYFKTHETLNDENRAWLKANVDLDCKTLLLKMSRDQILGVGTDPKTNAFSASRLARTLVWQTLARVLAKEIKPRCGNIRAFYYNYLDPLLVTFNLYKELRHDPEFQAFTRALTEDFPYERYTRAELVEKVEISKSYAQDLNEDVLRDFVKHKIFKYSGPFLFPDTEAGYRLIGTSNASLFVVIEKDGLWDLARGYWSQYGITVMTSKGNPSWVATEYLADQLAAKKIKHVRMATIVDWDPGGACIAEDYKAKLENFGFRVSSTMITKPSLFLKSVLKGADDLSHLKNKAKQKLVDEWFEKTGGIDGRKAGIHVNLAVTERIDKAVDDWFGTNSSKALAEDYV